MHLLINYSDCRGKSFHQFPKLLRESLFLLSIRQKPVIQYVLNIILLALIPPQHLQYEILSGGRNIHIVWECNAVC